MRCERVSERCGMNRCTKRYYIRIKYDVLLNYKKRANSIRKLKPVFASIVHQVCDMVAVRERTKAKNLMCAQLKIWKLFPVVPSAFFVFLFLLSPSLSLSFLAIVQKSKRIFDFSSIYTLFLGDYLLPMFGAVLPKFIPSQTDGEMRNEGEKNSKITRAKYVKRSDFPVVCIKHISFIIIVFNQQSHPVNTKN